eukprot:m51a1_g6919 putative C-tail anchored protein (287) ;mRNA; r:148173-149119
MMTAAGAILLALLTWEAAGAGGTAVCDCGYECPNRTAVQAGANSTLVSGRCPYGWVVLVHRIRAQSSVPFALCTSAGGAVPPSSGSSCYSGSSPRNTTCFQDLEGFSTSHSSFAVVATCLGSQTCDVAYSVRATCLRSSEFAWSVGAWSACGADCHQTAPLTCLEDSKRAVGPSNCTPESIPTYRRRCDAGQGQCAQGTIEPAAGQCRCWCSNTTMDDEAIAGTFPSGPDCSGCSADACQQRFPTACPQPSFRHGFVGSVCGGNAALGLAPAALALILGLALALAA